MNLTIPMLYLKLLADKHLQPGAFIIEIGKGDSVALPPLLETTGIATLAARLPGFYTPALADNLSPELHDALEAIGLRRLPESDITRCDGTLPPTPPNNPWLSGNWYLSPPARLTGSQAASQALALKLIQLVAAEADTRDLEAVFRQDPVLAYNLLRLVNSLGAGVGKHINSFSQAILILGRHQLKRWLNLLLFASNKNDCRSAMLLGCVSVRARSMELLAAQAGLDRAKQELAFMTGMFSLLGILFGMPLAEVVEPLRLNDAINTALFTYKGELGQLLKITMLAEQHRDDADLSQKLAEIGIAPMDFGRISVNAHLWMLDIVCHDPDSRHE